MQRANLTPADNDIGEVEASRIPETVPGHRHVSTFDGMVRIRDRDSTGKLIADHGYTPERARKLARMLLQGADRLDPPKAEGNPQ